MRDVRAARAWRLAGFLLATLALGGKAAAEARPAAHRVAADLAALGPRAPGTPTHRAAAGRLLAAMRAAGLAEVRAVPAVSAEGGIRNLTGVLPGKGAGEIVLSAHWDTVAGSPGAGDDASGCGVVLAAAADLARTPLAHTVRVVLFDQEETGLRGSRAWLERLGETGRAGILAAVNLEMVGWAGSAGPVIHVLPARGPDGERTLTPGWLVHALLRGGEAVGWSPAVADARLSLPAQLVLRAADPAYGSDAESFLARGVPAATVSDSSLLSRDPAHHRPADRAGRLDPERLARWSELTAATVRRLDALAGRPLPEDVYLAAFGRVWLRRDLYWLGFVLWVLLVLRGGTGRLQTRDPEERARHAREILPGFAFRVLLLLAILVTPVFSVLLYPAALLALPRLRQRSMRLLATALGLLPFAALLLAVALATRQGLLHGLALSPLESVLLPATLAAFVVTVGRERRDDGSRAEGGREDGAQLSEPLGTRQGPEGRV